MRRLADIVCLLARFSAGILEGRLYLNHLSKFRGPPHYEAVAQALRIFRDNNWVEDIGHGQTPITVKVKHPEIEHMVRVQDFERWLEASPRSPAEMILKNRLRELLAKGN